MKNIVYVGFDPREAAAFAVTRSSIRRHATQPVPIVGLVLSELRNYGYYTRKHEWIVGRNKQPIMWDTVSDAPMATEFANSRFLVPFLAQTGWALFCDCDMLFRANVTPLFASLDKRYAVYCVKHNYQPHGSKKMDGQIQTKYPRKLWSSFMIFNCDHPANEMLTPDYVNTLPGRDLHRFCWLRNDEIGELGEEWNWIPHHSPDTVEPKCVHFTEGGPWFPGFDDLPYANEWQRELELWAGGL